MTVVINGTTGVSGVAGSASVPAFIGSDADSGYYINSANEPNAAVNGTATWSAASTFGFKNRIINGAMVIDQRNAGASVTITNTAAVTYIVDRWAAYGSQASKISAQQNAGGVTPPAGYKNYYGITSLSAYSIGASDVFTIAQYVEGLNCVDLAWGTASAAPVTLSFWVRSSLTGTFGGVVQNSGSSRSYTFSYTINSANTWEQKSITIAGETTGTWLTNTGIGIVLIFGLAVGSTYQGAAGSWGTTNYQSVTGQTSIVGTNGATFYITGVQLEKGSTATSFDYRPYGTELALCQRYCQVYGGSSTPICNSGFHGSNDGYGVLSFPVSMRSAVTGISATASGWSMAAAAGTDSTGGSLSFLSGSTSAVWLYYSGGASGTATAGSSGQIRPTTVGTLTISTEL